MGEIRFVGTGETRGYPYLVCKKCSSFTMVCPPVQGDNPRVDYLPGRRGNHGIPILYHPQP